MDRSQKEQIIAEVAEQFSRAKSMYFADFTGINVEQVNELRREFRKSNIDYRVVKNTLARKALEKVGGYDGIFDNLSGPTAVAIGYEDPVLPAKIIKKFRDKHDKLNVKVCVLEHQIFKGSQLDEISKLPGRLEIMSEILSCIQSPLTGVQSTIAAVMRDLVNVIDAIEKKKAA